VTRLVASELLKLRTTRTSWALMGGALALISVISAIAAALGDFTGATPGLSLLAIAALGQLFVLVAGVITITTEYRQGTITPSLLVEPVRGRLLAAKLAAQLIVGLLIGAIAFGVCAGLAAGILSSRGIATGMSTGDWVGSVIGGAVATMLYGALGLGVGAILRNQAGAIVVVLAWIFVIENLLSIIPGFAIGRYGLAGVATGLSQAVHQSKYLHQAPAGLLLLGYTLALVLAGAIVFRWRDVS
jgi:ABC-2 type transport system permease protein